MAEQIPGLVNAQLRGHISRFESLGEIDSTNDFILRAPADERHGYFVIAERQTAGKGRNGRPWQSPAGGNIYLSFGWEFETMPPAFSLQVGICVCAALQQFGLQGHGVKWPNDILVSGRKIAGILVETALRSRGTVCAVTGIGINVVRESLVSAGVDQPWTDLGSELPVDTFDTSPLIASLISELLGMLTSSPDGMKRRLEYNWPQWDALAGNPVSISRGEEVYEGRAGGISPSGALRIEKVVEHDGDHAALQVMEFASGEASVRYA